MSNGYADSGKWKRIVDLSLNNYSNMNKRLSHKKKIAEFVLVYYSVALIILALTAKWFSSCFNAELADYFGIVLSVVLLAYSLVNSTANYNQRVAASQEIINALKTIKRTLGDAQEPVPQDFVDKYNKLMDKAERREDIDFFRTLKQQCKEKDVKWWFPKDYASANYSELRNHLSEVDKINCQLKIFVDYLIDFILLSSPIAILWICFKY